MGNEDEYALLIENVREYAIFSVDLDGVITTWNPGAERLFGFRASEAIGASANIIFRAEDQAGNIAGREMEQARKNGRGEDDRWHQKKDGSLFWASGAMMPVWGEAGALKGYVKIVRDRTEDKLAREALEKALDEAKNLAQIKTRLVNTMSHEIRTPLTSIIGLAHLLAERVPEPLRKDARNIEEIGKQLAEILSSVLSLAKVSTAAGQGRGGPVDLRQAIKETVESLRPLFEEKNLVMDVHLPDEPVAYALDVTTVGRILMNLVGNAVKFTDDGEVHIGLESGSDEAILIVSDTGPGIDDDYLPYLFDEFVQAEPGSKKAGLGSGLGLSITRGLVEELEGRIEVSSARGKGTTFKVYLPLR